LLSATRADRRDIRALARHERFANSLWPVPAMFGVAALVGAAITVVIDSRVSLDTGGQHLLVGDTNTALTLTSVVATAMLAFLGIVYATTLVAIQLAASQYSPRAVRVFVRSRLTKISLGIFVATFMFSIVTLIAIRSADQTDRRFTPVLSTSGVVLLVIATIVAFLLFANGTARLLRVQYLVERIAEETRSGLDVAFDSGDGRVTGARPVNATATTTIETASYGVLDAVDVGDLATLAARLDGWIELVAPIGGYVAFGSTIAIVHSGPSSTPRPEAEALTAQVDECLLFSNERTMLQDPAFGFRQLVDIAIRALSPAVNDPTTAVQVIDRLTDLLGRVISRPDPAEWHVDESGAVRVRVPVDTASALVTLSFVEIIRFGADSPQVVRRLHAALDQLERTAGDAPTGLEQMQRLLDTAGGQLAVDAFTELSRLPDPRGLG
jgi:uncharacterized membrane protein